MFAEWAVGGLTRDAAAAARRPGGRGRRDARRRRLRRDLPPAARRRSRLQPAQPRSTSPRGSSARAGSPRMRSTSRASGRWSTWSPPAPRSIPFWLGKIAPERCRRRSRSCCSAGCSTRRASVPEFLDRAGRAAPDRAIARPGRPSTDCSTWSDHFADCLFRQRHRARVSGLHDDRARPPGGDARASRSATSRRPTSCWRPTTASTPTAASCPSASRRTAPSSSQR